MTKAHLSSAVSGGPPRRGRRLFSALGNQVSTGGSTRISSAFQGRARARLAEARGGNKQDGESQRLREDLFLLSFDRPSKQERDGGR